MQKPFPRKLDRLTGAMACSMCCQGLLNPAASSLPSAGACSCRICFSSTRASNSLNHLYSWNRREHTVSASRTPAFDKQTPALHEARAFQIALSAARKQNKKRTTWQRRCLFKASRKKVFSLVFSSFNFLTGKTGDRRLIHAGKAQNMQV